MEGRYYHIVKESFPYNKLVTLDVKTRTLSERNSNNDMTDILFTNITDFGYITDKDFILIGTGEQIFYYDLKFEHPYLIYDGKYTDLKYGNGLFCFHSEGEEQFQSFNHTYNSIWDYCSHKFSNELTLPEEFNIVIEDETLFEFFSSGSITDTEEIKQTKRQIVELIGKLQNQKIQVEIQKEVEKTNYEMKSYPLEKYINRKKEISDNIVCEDYSTIEPMYEYRKIKSKIPFRYYRIALNGPLLCYHINNTVSIVTMNPERDNIIHKPLFLRMNIF